MMSGIGMSAFLEKHMAHPTVTRSSSARCGQEEPLLSDPSSAPYSHMLAPKSKHLLTVMVFFEAIGLYGLVVALILSCHKK